MTDATTDPRLGVGGNFPPLDINPMDVLDRVDPFDALKIHADDLLDQARTIAAVENEDQLKALEDLAAELNGAADALEAERVTRKKPHDDAIAEIQATFNVYLAPLTNKTVKGKIPLALDAIKKAKEPYLQEQERQRRAEAERVRREAEEAARVAAEAARAAAGEDMESREEAEVLVVEAQALARNATRAETAATRGSGLRSYWVPELTDAMAALKHYIADRPDELKAWLMDQARKDVARAIRTIPGFSITEERRAA